MFQETRYFQSIVSLCSAKGSKLEFSEEKSEHVENEHESPIGALYSPERTDHNVRGTEF